MDNQNTTPNPDNNNNPVNQPVEPAVVEPQQTVSPVTAAAVTPQHKSRKKLYLILLIVVVLLVAAGGTFALYHSGHKTNKITVSSTSTGTTTTTQKPVTPAPVVTASWSMLNSPNGVTTGTNELNGLSCLSSSDCWAVGDYNGDNSTGYKTLAEQWNGSSWSTVTSPNTTNSGGDQLNDVYCTSSNNCWAVGGEQGGYGLAAVIEQWNGSSWTQQTSGVATVGDLLGITCTSSSNCWAVGDANGSNKDFNSLIEHWNGSQWSTVSTPNTTEAYYTSVACTSSSNCYAVGDTNTGDGSTSLIEHWNGSSWSAMTTQNPNSYENSFSSVECLSSSDCMAVGLSINNQANFIVDQWNGTSWQDATYNNPSGVATVSPQAITCISSTDCWIVGTQSATQGAAATLIALNWNGTSWLTSSSLTTPAAPPAGPQDGPAPPALSAISCNGANNCMAVGSYSDKSSGAQDTLADLYSAQ